MANEGNLFHYIKSCVSIMDVIGAVTTLKRAGHYWKGLCPFHHEKTPSFTVSPHREIFYCFGCHAGGDLISFVQKSEQCTSLEAAKLLVDRYNLSVPESVSFGDVNESTQGVKELYFKVHSHVAAWCHKQLLHNKEASEYLYARGFSVATIEQFLIGFFPKGHEAICALLEYLYPYSIVADDLVTCKLLNKGKGGLYSPFEQRIMFPIADIQGRCCGFGGRVFLEYDTRSKYYNSGEHELFNKGTLLYGLDRAKTYIQKENRVFLVEGYIDAIMMVQAGYKNTVATLGTACTVGHLKTLVRYAGELIVMYDSDSAGTQAIMRIAQFCWQIDLDLKVVVLPSGYDPAKFLLEGKDIVPFVQKAKSIFSFFIDVIAVGFHEQPTGQKLRLVYSFLDIIAELSSPIKCDLLLRQAAVDLQMSFDSLKEYVDHKRGVKVPVSSAPSTVNMGAHTKRSPVHNGSFEQLSQKPLQEGATEYCELQKTITRALLEDPTLINTDNKNYLQLCLLSPYGDIITRILEYQEKNGTINFVEFFSTLPESLQPEVSKLLIENSEKMIQKNDFDELLLQLKRKQWRFIVHDIKKKIKDAEKNKDTEAVKILMHEFLLLKKEIVR